MPFAEVAYASINRNESTSCLQSQTLKRAQKQTLQGENKIKRERERERARANPWSNDSKRYSSRFVCSCITPDSPLGSVEAAEDIAERFTER